MEDKKPTTLEECLETLADFEGAEEWVSLPEDTATIRVHHGLGRNIRNSWGLWDKDSDLHKYFKEIGIWHADDMSGIILTSLHRKLNNKPIKLENQVQYYKDYWQALGNDGPEEFSAKEVDKDIQTRFTGKELKRKKR